MCEWIPRISLEQSIMCFRFCFSPPSLYQFYLFFKKFDRNLWLSKNWPECTNKHTQSAIADEIFGIEIASDLYEWRITCYYWNCSQFIWEERKKAKSTHLSDRQWVMDNWARVSTFMNSWVALIFLARSLTLSNHFKCLSMFLFSFLFINSFFRPFSFSIHLFRFLVLVPWCRSK